MAILRLIYTLLNITNVALGTLASFLATQSPARLFLLFQGFLLVLYLVVAAISRYFLPSSYTGTVAIRIPASAEKVWDHLLDVTKNPMTGNLHVRTVPVSDTEWREEIGSQELVLCKTTEAQKPKRMVRELWAEAVYMKGQWIYVLETKPDDEKTTILRIYATVDALWGSFMTPLFRLVLTFRKTYVNEGVKEHLELLCKDMGVKYTEAEVWE